MTQGKAKMFGLFRVYREVRQVATIKETSLNLVVVQWGA